MALAAVRKAASRREGRVLWKHARRWERGLHVVAGASHGVARRSFGDYQTRHATPVLE
ncbi:hypothetical protein CALCODRAFT_491573 [Calocera cornea HHB12733]|uniref:Uncharacterized protein n=1 Tax=Calocera cornea HHB12733 TaxID=1353952 RepID=A0A165IZF4_9BASI|nr:hypothetical protein CALCODRAFT_491573 [Calocera cornea HHB12733]